MLYPPSNWGLIWREIRYQCLDNLRSSLPILVFIGLIGYVLTVLCSADYLREMGGAGVARNAPSMVYMMTSGQLFLLLFAWAWVFAQPIVRDRSAHLHELILAAPVSLPALLFGRYLGAVAVAVILGWAQGVGFVLAPVLEWMGMVPAGSVAPAPWVALGQGWLLLIVPCAFGFGALYLLAALRTRSLAGPFAVAAGLMLCWVLSMVVFDEQANDLWSRLLCPAAYTEVELQVKDWTAQEKASASLALTSTLLLNRFIWGVLPLFALGWALWRVNREALLLETAPTKPRRVQPVQPAVLVLAPLPRPVPQWWRATLAETCLQCTEVFRHKGIWLTVIGLAVLNVAGAFNHIVGHAEGPLLPRIELIVPLIRKMSFFFIVFVVAGLAGMRMRRDDVAGFGEMLDTCPAPDSVRLASRAAAIVTVTLLLALIPALSSILTALLGAPESFNLALAVGDSLLVNLPALLEFAAAIVLMHALIRPAGTAYSASMLVAFVFLVNHEAELVTFPPAQLGITLPIAYSALTGWQAWLPQVITLVAWKLSIVTLLLALAGLVLPRGNDGYWATLRRNLPARFKSPVGAVAVTTMIALTTLAPWLHHKFVIEGGYRTLHQQLAEDAQWERRWLPHVADFSVAGGTLDIYIHPAQQQLDGRWHLHGIQSANGQLHMEFPHGLHELRAQVNGQPAEVETAWEHAAVTLGQCAQNNAGCEVILSWQLNARGWNSEAIPPWLLPNGFWARAKEMAPQLGFDRNRILRAPNERHEFALNPDIPDISAPAVTSMEAIAPAGDWHWNLHLNEMLLDSGTTPFPLDFAAIWAPNAHISQIDTIRVWHDHTHTYTASSIAADAADMQHCVTSRTGYSTNIERIIQLPRGLGKTSVIGNTLLLPEQYAWDTADTGTGRWLRRADMAAALVRHALQTRGNLRDSPGAPILDEGLTGAVGLLCVGDSDGLPALTILLNHHSDTTTQTLAASPVPIGPALHATRNGWYTDYGPQALLAFAATLQPSDYSALISTLHHHAGDALLTLHAVFPQYAAKMLAPPQSTDLHFTNQGVTGDYWRWQDNGWVTHADPAELIWLAQTAHGLIPLNTAPADASFLVLPLFAWERAPKKDNAQLNQLNLLIPVLKE